MHSKSHSELQGASAPRTTQDGASPGGSRLRRGPLWAWLLMGALLVPGAWSFLSEEQEELLVELHNHYRGLVSPSASAMMPLKWDASLKVIAEGYAAKCVWNHNPDLEDTGENLYAGTKPLDLREALEEWFLENLNYDFNNNSCDEDKMCGHYTQMVWADTHRVGCAVHVCTDMEGLSWGRTNFLVCNYYPAGNYEGERPYVEGDWCSRCPENLQKCENNLCVDDTVDEDDVDDSDDEDVTEIPATTQPFMPLQETSEEEELKDEEEALILPPATTDMYKQPDTTAPPTMTSLPSITSSAEDMEEVQAENTPEPGTRAPEAPPTTAGGQAELKDRVGAEEERKEEEEEEEKMKPAEKAERDVIGKIFQNREGTMSAASVRCPSVLLACVTGVLTLRL